MSSVAKEIPRQDLLFTHASQPVLVAFLQTFTLLLHFLSCLLADSYRDRCSPGRDNGHAAKIAKWSLNVGTTAASDITSYLSNMALSVWYGKRVIWWMETWLAPTASRNLQPWCLLAGCVRLIASSIDIGRLQAELLMHTKTKHCFFPSPFCWPIMLKRLIRLTTENFRISED